MNNNVKLSILENNYLTKIDRSFSSYSKTNNNSIKNQKKESPPNKKIHYKY